MISLFFTQHDREEWKQRIQTSRIERKGNEIEGRMKNEEEESTENEREQQEQTIITQLSSSLPYTILLEYLLWHYYLSLSLSCFISFVENHVRCLPSSSCIIDSCSTWRDVTWFDFPYSTRCLCLCPGMSCRVVSCMSCHGEREEAPEPLDYFLSIVQIYLFIICRRLLYSRFLSYFFFRCDSMGMSTLLLLLLLWW